MHGAGGHMFFPCLVGTCKPFSHDSLLPYKPVTENNMLNTQCNRLCTFTLLSIYIFLPKSNFASDNILNDCASTSFPANGLKIFAGWMSECLDIIGLITPGVVQIKEVKLNFKSTYHQR